MADTSSAGPAPDVDPVSLGQRHDADLQLTIDALNAPNPHHTAMNLPPALRDDGGQQ